uniref:Uncharacterized protein n=1 Tax=Arundo donax TaxID=35708 RepID=A0A0A9B7F9_ARUDO
MLFKAPFVCTVEKLK